MLSKCAVFLVLLFLIRSHLFLHRMSKAQAFRKCERHVQRNEAKIEQLLKSTPEGKALYLITGVALTEMEE